MEKIWLKSYPDGVPEEIDITRYDSIGHILMESCKRYAGNPAFRNMGVAITFADVERLSRDFGAYLTSVAGLKKGDRLAIMMPNLLQYVVALFGALREGIVVVNCNPLYTPRELGHQLNDSGSVAILVLENFASTVEKVLPESAITTVITTRMGDMFPFPKGPIVNLVVKHVKKMVPPWSIPGAIPFRKALAQGGTAKLSGVEVTRDDTAFLQYTGGTTGVAKGAVLTHGNLIANMLQTGAWLREVTAEKDEVLIAALPMYHVFCLTTNCLCYMQMGAENVLITNPRDTAGLVKELGGIPFTGFIGVNTLFNALLNTPGFDQLDFSTLKVNFGGGMAVQKAVAERWREVTGVPISEGYGLTETSPVVSINKVSDAEFTGSIGLPLSSTEISIRNDQGEELPVGEVGEICVRGPQVMREYYNRPAETANVFLEDGWLRTGDIARMDEQGFTYIEDRKKDMILVSGFNVYPNEVESVAVSHEGVLEAAAIGIPHPRSGEVVKLFAVRKDPSLTEEALRAFCKERLTAYKVPKQIEFRESLPKTNVGKILRRALREGSEDS